MFKREFLVLLAAVFVTACTEQDSSKAITDTTSGLPADSQTVATVNGTQISQDVVDLFIQQRANANRAELNEEQLEELINQVVNFELLAQDAATNKLDTGSIRRKLTRTSRRTSTRAKKPGKRPARIMEKCKKPARNYLPAGRKRLMPTRTSR